MIRITASLLGSSFDQMFTEAKTPHVCVEQSDAVIWRKHYNRISAMMPDQNTFVI